jgi:hypothetical protein
MMGAMFARRAALALALAAAAAPGRPSAAQPAPPAPPAGPQPSAPAAAAPCPEPGAPEGAEARLQAATVALRVEADYDKALRLAEPLTLAAPAAIRVRALALAAVAHLILGDAARAEPVLADLYELAPGFLLDDPSLSPRITDAFDRAAARPHRRAVKLELRQNDGEPLGFWLLARGAAESVHLACRAGRAAPFAPLDLRALAPGADGRVWRTRLPSGGRFQCHAVAHDASALPLGRLGTPRAPVDVEWRLAPPPPEPALVERWWFWASIAGAAALVAGGIVVAVVATSAGTEPPEADVTLEIESARPVELLRF